MTYTSNNTNFSDFLGKVYASRKHTRVCFGTANDFQEAHYICRRKEMKAKHIVRSFCKRRDLINIQIRRV